MKDQITFGFDISHIEQVRQRQINRISCIIVKNDIGKFDLKQPDFIYMFTLNVGLFFLSIPIPGFVPSDRFAWNGPLRLSFTDRRNSSLRSSDTTGRAFGNPNRTLVPAPMVFRHKTLHLTLTRLGKGRIRKILQNKIPAHLYRIMDSWVTLPENLFSLKFLVFRSVLACQLVIT